jgi:pimeloyl-ACP methyl ester carboxylesterase
MGSIRLVDGRELAFDIGGDPDGFPVVGLHGTPGCRLSRWPDDGPYREAGVCYVTTDRAGYGRSDRHHGRSVASEAADICELADALGIDTFAVTGGSGGGPHALACAALLADRVVRAACFVGVAPFGPSGLDRDRWLDGMDPENVTEHHWAEAGEHTLTRELHRVQLEMEAQAQVDPAELFGNAQLSEPDREFMRRPEVVLALGRAVKEQAAHGVGGWVDDVLAFIRPWGFDVRDIRVPTLVSYSTNDTFTPPAHGEWLAANVPGCVTQITGTGHMPTDPLAEIAEQMAWLQNGLVPPAASTDA